MAPARACWADASESEEEEHYLPPGRLLGGLWRDSDQFLHRVTANDAGGAGPTAFSVRTTCPSGRKYTTRDLIRVDRAGGVQLSDSYILDLISARYERVRWTALKGGEDFTWQRDDSSGLGRPAGNGSDTEDGGGSRSSSARPPWEQNQGDKERPAERVERVDMEASSRREWASAEADAFPSVMKASKSKSVPRIQCKYFLRKACARGAACPFLHEALQGREAGESQEAHTYKREPWKRTWTDGTENQEMAPGDRQRPREIRPRLACKYFMRSACTRGAACTFSHEVPPRHDDNEKWVGDDEEDRKSYQHAESLEETWDEWAEDARGDSREDAEENQRNGRAAIRLIPSPPTKLPPPAPEAASALVDTTADLRAATSPGATVISDAKLSAFRPEAAPIIEIPSQRKPESPPLPAPETTKSGVTPPVASVLAEAAPAASAAAGGESSERQSSKKATKAAGAKKGAQATVVATTPSRPEQEDKLLTPLPGRRKKAQGKAGPPAAHPVAPPALVTSAYGAAPADDESGSDSLDAPERNAGRNIKAKAAPTSKNRQAVQRKEVVANAKTKARPQEKPQPRRYGNDVDEALGSDDGWIDTPLELSVRDAASWILACVLAVVVAIEWLGYHPASTLEIGVYLLCASPCVYWSLRPGRAQRVRKML